MRTYSIASSSYEFIDRQQYDVKTIDGMEFDEYDTLASVYLVYSENGRTVLGCSRLTPIAYPRAHHSN